MMQEPLIRVPPPASAISKNRLTKAGERLRAMQADPSKFEDDTWLEETRVVDEWRRSFTPAMRATNMWLRSAASRFSCRTEVVSIQARSKRITSIVNKLCDKPTLRLPQMEDVAGARVVLETQDALRALQHWLENGRTSRVEIEGIDDYIAHPRPGGYRAVHLHTIRTVTRKHQRLGEWRVEIQLRTRRQQNWAEVIEAIDDDLQSDLKHEKPLDGWDEPMLELAGIYADLDGRCVPTQQASATMAEHTDQEAGSDEV